MMKTFTVAGTSNLEGVVKFRVANGSAKARTAVLVRSGHTDIQLQDLPKPMTKEDAIAFIGGKTNIGSLVINKGPALVADINKVKSKVAKAPAKTAPKEVEELAAQLAEFDAQDPSEYVPAFILKGKTKEVPAKQMLGELGIKPSVREQNMDEVARVKAKNLETMRRVSQRLKAIREF